MVGCDIFGWLVWLGQWWIVWIARMLFNTKTHSNTHRYTKLYTKLHKFTQVTNVIMSNVKCEEEIEI